MSLTNRQKNHAIYIRELVQTAGWKVYEEFIKDFVFDYLNSSLSKETLNGLKMSIDEAKKLVIVYEAQRS